jgi:hypothetical protein
MKLKFSFSYSVGSRSLRESSAKSFACRRRPAVRSVELVPFATFPLYPQEPT